jgi:uncharacterized membrane protein YqhA
MSEARDPLRRALRERNDDDATNQHAPTPLASLIGRSRFVVLIGVGSVLLLAVGLFILGAIQALTTLWHAGQAMLRGDVADTSLTVEFLSIVSVMLKAVIFYIIGVGFYSLFIAPLNITEALGVDTFQDLETKVVSVVIVIMAVTFLEHFIAWQQPADTLMFGAALALVVASLVLFQFYSQRSKEEQHQPGTMHHARRELFQRGQERLDVEQADRDNTSSPAEGSAAPQPDLASPNST